MYSEHKSITQFGTACNCFSAKIQDSSIQGVAVCLFRYASFPWEDVYHSSSLVSNLSILHEAQQEGASETHLSDKFVKEVRLKSLEKWMCPIKPQYARTVSLSVRFLAQISLTENIGEFPNTLNKNRIGSHDQKMHVHLSSYCKQQTGMIANSPT
ncbi:hypothetical protein Anapl_14128 [Anas platyrhynchos]|uniref:Uncharacterized protein n=1 Tax=Anas platyrhynchos TaxID=8839 RepID=R0L3U5_ANAPL|nr:hypothetical protein Anapl_14128 [Anas platyrhynchos]